MTSILKMNTQNIVKFSICLILPIISILSNDEIIAQQKSGLFLFWLLSAGLIYLLWNVLRWITTIKSKSKYWWVLITYILFIGLTASIAYSLDMKYNIQQMVRVSFAILLVFLIQYALKAQEDIVNLQLEKEQYKSEGYKSQLKLLQAKIDPHFLFNSLNTLQSMVSYGHKNSVPFIINLSNFYRQNMSHVQDSSISIAEELKVLNSYLFLMKSRYEDAVEIDINIDDTVLSKTLPTMSLQIIVENCFKHNRMTASSPMKIQIQNTVDGYISVINNLQVKVEKSDSEGYGLSSLKKRYQLLNIDEGVIINRDEQTFEVKIKYANQ